MLYAFVSAFFWKPFFLQLFRCGKIFELSISLSFWTKFLYNGNGWEAIRIELILEHNIIRKHSCSALETASKEEWTHANQPFGVMVKFCTIVPHAKRKLHGETNITALFLPLIYCFSNKRAVGFTFPWIDIINKSVITLFFLLDTRWPFLEIPKETLKTQRNHKMLQECFWSVGKHQNQIPSISFNGILVFG